CVLVFVFVMRIMDVHGTSMVPTLHNGDKVLVSGLFYEPERGDIVVFKKDGYDDNKALVKRVIAVAGDVVNIDFERGIVYINGEAAEEDYIDVLTTTKIDFIGPQTVPDNCLFVLGDNRNASTDSRDKRIGMVDKRLVIGKVLLVIYPFDSFGGVE
ncbi:MAG: signal peptidase I, partial [Oscillospiraceae bacterium]|nr:signal peptidase I [Oscillospiraceae bacterium]